MFELQEMTSNYLLYSLNEQCSNDQYVQMINSSNGGSSNADPPNTSAIRLCMIRSSVQLVQPSYVPYVRTKGRHQKYAIGCYLIWTTAV